jgi:hypothetical protein
MTGDGGRMTVQVRVYLDKSGPGHSAGLLRCLDVVSEDEKGNERSHDNLIDNREFPSAEQLIAHIANYFKISKDRVVIEDE